MHSCVPDREAGGSPRTASAVCGVCPSAVAPSPPSALPPVAPAHAAVSAQPLGGYAARCAAAAPAPGDQCKIHTCMLSLNTSDFENYPEGVFHRGGSKNALTASQRN